MRLATWLRRPIVWAPISLALLAIVAWRSRLWEAGDRLGRVDIIPLAAALALSALIPVLWAIRSASLLRAADRPVSVRPLIPMTALANTVNNLTPGSSGEILRLWLLRAHHGVDYATGGAVILVERVAALAYLSGSAVLFWLAVVAGLRPAAVLLALAVLIALPGVAYGLGIRPSRAVAAVPLGHVVGRERWARLGGWLRRVDDTIASLLTRPARLLSFAAATGGVLACYTLQLILVGRALGVSLDPVAAWGALGLGLTAGVLSLLPFGLGSTDFVVASLLGVVGVPPIEATAMTFGYRLVSTVPLALAGVVSYAMLSAGLPDASALMSAVRRETVGADGPDGGLA